MLLEKSDILNRIILTPLWLQSGDATTELELVCYLFYKKITEQLPELTVPGFSESTNTPSPFFNLLEPLFGTS